MRAEPSTSRSLGISDRAITSDSAPMPMSNCARPRRLMPGRALAVGVAPPCAALTLVARFQVNVAPDVREFAQRREDVTGAHGGTPRRARVMPHTEFYEAKAVIFGFCQDFSIDEKLLRFDGDSVEDFAAKELEGTIDVAHVDAKHDAHQQIESPAQNQSRQRVEAIDAKAADDVGLFDERQQSLHLFDIELIIRV